MSALLKTIGGILLISGIIWGVTIVVGIATHMTGFATIKEITPGLVFHAGALFTGMMLIGLGFKVKKHAIKKVTVAD